MSFAFADGLSYIFIVRIQLFCSQKLLEVSRWVSQLLCIFPSQFTSACNKQRRLAALLRKNAEGAMTAKEQQELEDLHFETSFSTLKKAKALVLLKSRGEQLPPPFAKKPAPKDCSAFSIPMQLLPYA